MAITVMGDDPDPNRDKRRKQLVGDTLTEELLAEVLDRLVKHYTVSVKRRDRKTAEPLVKATFDVIDLIGQSAVKTISDAEVPF